MVAIALPLAWSTIKVIGVVLFILCVGTLILDASPRYQAKRVGMMLSWVSWPLFFLWIVGVLIKGFS
ncbi:MAG: hypothetical protein Q7R79_05585 [bacterium]|nr:hypothetical protein [bacterium]